MFILSNIVNWKGDYYFFINIAFFIFKIIFFLIFLLIILIILFRFFDNESLLNMGFVFLFTIAITSYFAFLKVDPHHDGIMLKPAIDILHGNMLFKDTFTMYGALTVLLQSLSLKIFGEYLFVLRLLTSFFYGLISVFLWLIWSNFLKKQVSTFVTIVWILMGHFYIYHYSIILFPWATVFAVFSIVLAIYLFFIYLEKDKNIYLFFIGIIISTIFWFKI